jgi:hypothetical protein
MSLLSRLINNSKALHFILRVRPVVDLDADKTIRLYEEFMCGDMRGRAGAGHGGRIGVPAGTPKCGESYAPVRPALLVGNTFGFLSGLAGAWITLSWSWFEFYYM